MHHKWYQQYCSCNYLLSDNMKNVAVSHNPALHKSFQPTLVDGCNILKEKTAALINPVLNLSRLLKSAAIGLIVVNHVCQWCRKV